MVTATIHETVSFVVETCCNCGIHFAIPSTFQHHRREDRKSFYCPNGHGQYYTGKSEKDRADELARQLASTKDMLATARKERENAQLVARLTNGKLRKIKTRVAAGLCACCNRTFQNLGRHMQTKHPEFAAAEEPA